MLIALASTEWYASAWYAFPIALVCFFLRQPTMALAQPMTTELVMNYVGTRNQEIVSAFQATIWNGAFVFSALSVSIMRGMDMPFATIFLITASLYLVGIFFYVLLIRDYKKKLAAGEIE